MVKFQAILVPVLLCVGCEGFAPSRQQHQWSHLRIISRDDDGSSASISPTQLLLAKKDTKGVYARPSAAIERGSGFFIPGLEGPRVRLVFGIALLVLTAVNHYLLTSGDAINQLAETTGVFYAVLLLLQAAIEFGKESKGYVVSLDRPDEQDNSENRASLVQQWSKIVHIDDDRVTGAFQEKVEWSAASYIALTPANSFLLISHDEIQYQLGKDGKYIEDGTETACQAALSTLSKAKSGRVSIPLSHPAAILATESERTIVLQTIDQNTCVFVTSNQLLNAFTDQDLKWLGQIALYLKLD